MTIVTHQPPKGIVLLRTFFCVVLALVICTPVHAQRSGGRPNGPGTGKAEELVPWKFVENGAAIEKGSLSLYWLPASQKEMEQSPLLASPVILEDSLRCVAVRIVAAENAATIKLLDATGKLPTAMLVNDQGVVIRRLENVRGILAPASVERLVKDELAARDEAMYHAMSEARRHASSGENEAAIGLYKAVWNDRCFFPMAGTEAQRALKALGVEVHDVPPPALVDPQLKPPPSAKPPVPPPHSGHEH